MDKASPHCFHLRIELLEDLHTGCGTGSGIIDRTLARDHQGRPLVPGSHLRGVWRDTGERLVRLGAIGQDQLDGLFGQSGTGRGALVVGDLRPEKAARTLTWDATARRAGSRSPDDHSLRRTEYLAAGTCLAGEGRLETDAAGLRHAFEQILYATDRIGSERSRGSGQIRILACEWSDPRSEGLLAGALPSTATRLRLLLRAEAPVCIPTTGFPGNIVPGETHIPGRMLFGALAGWAVANRRKPETLFERRIAVGPAYPLPAGAEINTVQALAGLQVLPIPLSLHTPKPSPAESTPWPHWAPGPGTPGAEPPADKPARFKDMLAGEDTPEPAELHRTRYKRPKSNAYLHRSATGDWRAFLVPLGLRMRNQRGSSLVDIPRTETSLFTTELIPAGTHFVADLIAKSPQDLQRLSTELAGLIATTPSATQATRSLRIGRGGAPVAVVGWCEPDTPKKPTSSQADELRITLTSDLIARDPVTLGFYTRLSARMLCDLLELDPPDPEQDHERVYSDTQHYTGFNAVSGLPAPPKRAIRRGSALRIRGPIAEQLREKLAGRGALGGRRWEGCGRFVLDFAPDPARLTWLATDPPATDEQRAEEKRIGNRERLIAAAGQFMEDLEAKQLHLTRSQIGNLRDLIAHLPESAKEKELRDAFEKFSKRVATRRDRDTWDRVFEDLRLIDRLVESCDSDHLLEDADLFLRVLRLGLEPSRQ